MKLIWLEKGIRKEPSWLIVDLYESTIASFIKQNSSCCCYCHSKHTPKYNVIVFTHGKYTHKLEDNKIKDKIIEAFNPNLFIEGTSLIIWSHCLSSRVMLYPIIIFSKIDSTKYQFLEDIFDIYTFNHTTIVTCSSFYHDVALLSATNILHYTNRLHFCGNLNF